MSLFQSFSFLFIWYSTYFMLFICIYIIILIYFFVLLLLLLFFFFLKQVVQSTFRMEKIYHSIAQQLNDERKRRVSAVQTLTIAENSNADLREKLKAEEQERKSVDAALKSAETQAESQRKLANEVKGQFGCSQGADCSPKAAAEGG